MRPTLSIQEQQNRWDAERAQSAREATKQVVEEDEDELPMVSVLLRLPPVPPKTIICVCIVIRLLSADYTDLQLG